MNSSLISPDDAWMLWGFIAVWAAFEHLFGAAVSLGCGCIGGCTGTGRIDAVYECRDSSGRVARL